MSQLAESRNSETQLAANSKKQRDYESELSGVMTQTQSESRITRSEVDGAVIAAEKTCKERDAAAKNPRLTDIPKVIRGLEEKVHKIQAELEDHEQARESLRLVSDDENAVVLLGKQIDHDEEILMEGVEDLRYPGLTVNRDSLENAAQEALEKKVSTSSIAPKLVTSRRLHNDKRSSALRASFAPS